MIRNFKKWVSEKGVGVGCETDESKYTRVNNKYKTSRWKGNNNLQSISSWLQGCVRLIADFVRSAYCPNSVIGLLPILCDRLIADIVCSVYCRYCVFGLLPILCDWFIADIVWSAYCRDCVIGLLPILCHRLTTILWVWFIVEVVCSAYCQHFGFELYQGNRRIAELHLRLWETKEPRYISTLYNSNKILYYLNLVNLLNQLCYVAWVTC